MHTVSRQLAKQSSQGKTRSEVHGRCHKEIKDSRRAGTNLLRTLTSGGKCGPCSCEKGRRVG